MTHALRLAHDLHARALGRQQVVDHLKLQKLTFYGYGAAIAHGCRAEVGQIAFSPWKHGPVNLDVWDHHRGSGATPLPPPPAPALPTYSTSLASLLDDVIDTYGRLDSWKLRCESHLEQPWIDGWNARSAVIPDSAIEKHFADKFALGNVRLPLYLGTHATAALDGIPAARFLSLHDMANALRSRR